MIVLVIATICFCMGVVTAATKAPTLLSPLEWWVVSIAIMVLFRGLA